MCDKDIIEIMGAPDYKGTWFIDDKKGNLLIYSCPTFLDFFLKNKTIIQGIEVSQTTKNAKIFILNTTTDGKLLFIEEKNCFNESTVIIEGSSP